MKRFISLLLLLVLLFSAVGCGTSSQTSDGGSSTPEQKEAIDMEGYICTMYYLPSSNYDETSVFWYKTGTVFYDMAVQRIKDIENEYNCTVKTVAYASNDDKGFLSDISLAAATGANGPDISLLRLFTTVIDMCQADLFLPLDEYEDIIPIHDESVYGPANIQEQALYNGHPYMVIPYTHPERQLIINNFLTFNETLMNTYNVADLREVYEQKKWTWDYFEEYLRNATVKEEGTTKIYAFAHASSITIHALSSNGFALAVKDESGNYVNGCTQPNVIETIDWLKRVKTEYMDCIKEANNAIDMMIDGSSFLCANQVGDLTGKIQFEVERFGVLPFPYGPSGTYGVGNIDSEMFGGGISSTSSDPELAATILNAYCQPFAEYPTAEDALSVYDSIFFDKRDITTLQELTKTVRNLYWGSDGYPKLTNAINNGLKNKTATEIVTGIEDVMQEVVDTFIIPNADYVETYFK